MPGSSAGTLPPPVGHPSSTRYDSASTPASTISDVLPGTPPTGSRPGSTMSPPPGSSDDLYGSSTGHQPSTHYKFGPHPDMPTPYQPGSVGSSPEPSSFGGMVPRTAPMPIFVTTQGLSSSALQTALDPPELIHTGGYSSWTSDSTYSTTSEMPSRQRFWRHPHQNSIEWSADANLLSTYPNVARQEISTSGRLETMATPYFVSTAFPVSPQLVPHIAASHASYSSEPLISTGFADEQAQALLDPAIASMHQRSSSVRSTPPPTSTSTSGQVADTLVTPAPLHPRIDPMAQARHKELVMEVLSADGGSPQWNGESTGGSGIPTGPGLSGLNGCGIGGIGTVTSLPRSVQNAIPTYIDLYWERFHIHYPVVHRRSFEGSGEEVLRYAMAAIATQFMNGKEDRIRGSQLHEYAWQEAKRVSDAFSLYERDT